MLQCLSKSYYRSARKVERILVGLWTRPLFDKKNSVILHRKNRKLYNNACAVRASFSLSRSFSLFYFFLYSVRLLSKCSI